MVSNVLLSINHKLNRYYCLIETPTVLSRKHTASGTPREGRTWKLLVSEKGFSTILVTTNEFDQGEYAVLLYLST